MALFAMPIILMIDADSVEEAQKSIDDWAEEVDYDGMPVGLEDIDHAPQCEVNDEGHRLLYVPAHDGADDDMSDDEDDEDDDFNDGDPDF